MERKQIDELVAKYNEGLADPAEIKLLEKLIAAGEVDLTWLHELTGLDEQIQKMEMAGPSLGLDDKFYTALADEKRASRKMDASFSFPSLNSLFPRLAMATVLILSGFALGYFLQSPQQKTEVSELTKEVGDLKEMIMLSLLEKESATQRLKAVSLTSEMDQASDKVTNALFVALNKDENVNVRLAALEALKPYVGKSTVRLKLIESIGEQDSPLVQMALAELMVSIHEKKSVDALKELLGKESTPEEVKTKLTESIKILI
jgi:hypothetical protein